jgi:hypothetical protein
MLPSNQRRPLGIKETEEYRDVLLVVAGQRSRLRRFTETSGGREAARGEAMLVVEPRIGATTMRPVRRTIREPSSPAKTAQAFCI